MQHEGKTDYNDFSFEPFLNLVFFFPIFQVDNAEYALLTAIVIFSERENVCEPKRVEKIQEIYVEALQSYVMARRKRDHMVAFAKLLSALTTLRTLGNSNAKACFNMKTVNRKLPEFLAEIWDIN